MAKKKSKTAKPSAKKARREPAEKASKKHAREHHHHDEHYRNKPCEEVEIELDDTEQEAIDMVFDSDELRLAMETEVDAAVTAAVRKVCRQYGTPLSTAQAQNVAMVLFGD
jgi:hypothetical protein